MKLYSSRKAAGQAARRAGYSAGQISIIGRADGTFLLSPLSGVVADVVVAGAGVPAYVAEALASEHVAAEPAPEPEAPVVADVAAEIEAPACCCDVAVAPEPSVESAQPVVMVRLVIEVVAAEADAIVEQIARLVGRLAVVEPVVEPPVRKAAAGKPAGLKQGGARSIIVAAMSRPEGASSAELFAATEWKFASWSHQQKLAADATGLVASRAKVDGVTRYFLKGGVAPRSETV